MKKERKVNMILAIVLWLICIAMFLPMVFVIINSFKILWTGSHGTTGIAGRVEF